MMLAGSVVSERFCSIRKPNVGIQLAFNYGEFPLGEVAFPGMEDFHPFCYVSC